MEELTYEEQKTIELPTQEEQELEAIGYLSNMPDATNLAITVLKNENTIGITKVDSKIFVFNGVRKLSFGDAVRELGKFLFDNDIIFQSFGIEYYLEIRFLNEDRNIEMMTIVEKCVKKITDFFNEEYKDKTISEWLIYKEYINHSLYPYFKFIILECELTKNDIYEFELDQLMTAMLFDGLYPKEEKENA